MYAYRKNFVLSCFRGKPTRAMVSRIGPTFERLRAAGQPGLVTYTTAGDPDLPQSAEILRALDRAGADVLEVGVPFSDPLADGPVIQRATERALAAGTTLRGVLAMIERVRPSIAAPVVLFSYANPLLRLGVGAFARQAAAAGVDGVLALDLPIEEAQEFRETLRMAGLDTIFLLSPTTTDQRIRRAVELGSGFLYGISRLGVTGARDRVASGAETLARRIRAQTSLPIALGFGISRPEHVAEVCAYADAAVVGSALVSVVAETSGSPQLIERVEDYVRWLKGAPTAVPH
jgi:tryptophan synthase alpha chain